MDRRALIRALALAGLAVPGVARGQAGRRPVRIGILGLTTTADLIGPQPKSSTAVAFLEGLRELGYEYGEHFVTEPRGSDGRPERFADLARQLVQLPVDVIVATNAALPALRGATSTIPVIMAAAIHPVGEGHVQSLRRPGGNVTGLSLQSVETSGKRLEVLREIVPGPAPVGVLWNRASLLNWQAAETAARERGWKVLSIEIPDASRIEAAFDAAVSGGAGALLVFAAGVLYTRARRVADLAARRRLPAIYELRPYVDAGGLMSYGADINDVWRRAAGFVDKILKGAGPAELPVEQPVKFELVINLRTARALGLEIPQSVLLRADEVLQ